MYVSICIIYLSKSQIKNGKSQARLDCISTNRKGNKWKIIVKLFLSDVWTNALMRINCAFVHANLGFRTSTRWGVRVFQTMTKVSLLFATIIKFFQRSSIPAKKNIKVANIIAKQGEVIISERKSVDSLLVRTIIKGI